MTHHLPLSLTSTFTVTRTDVLKENRRRIGGENKITITFFLCRMVNFLQSKITSNLGMKNYRRENSKGRQTQDKEIDRAKKKTKFGLI